MCDFVTLCNTFYLRDVFQTLKVIEHLKLKFYLKKQKVEKP